MKIKVWLIRKQFPDAIVFAMKNFQAGVAGLIEILKSRFDRKFSGKVRLKNIK